MKAKPLHNWVIVKLPKEGTVSAGGIVLMDTADDDTIKAEVVSVGPRLQEKDSDVKPGHLVIFKGESAVKILNVDKSYRMVKEKDILAILLRPEDK